MTTTPLYDALVTEQKFDPASVTPIQTRTDRVVSHQKWLHEATARVAAAEVKPKRTRTRKAS